MVDLKTYFWDALFHAGNDWMASNPEFICEMKVNGIKIEGNDIVLDAKIAFRPESIWIRDKFVWFIDAECIIGNEKSSITNVEEVYEGMLSCLNESFMMTNSYNESRSL